VRGRGRGDDNRLNVRIGEKIVEIRGRASTEWGRDCFGRIWMRIGDCDQTSTWDSTSKDFGMRGADTTSANQPYTYGFGQRGFRGFHRKVSLLSFWVPRKLYPLLFDCAAQSLLEFGRNRLKGDLGITAVLHTWGQKLDFHPHLHCIVTGGALSPEGKQWRSPKQRKFLFPVQAVAALFRGKFLAGLAQMLDAGELHLPNSELKIPVDRARWFSLLYSKRWVLYAKRPFGGPQQVLSYLANYTHRVALSNRRIVAVDAQHQSVTFTYRDYRHGSLRKELTLSALEFIRRFSLHILPPGLVRIRHYGILANNRRKRDIDAACAILVSRGCALELQSHSVADPACSGMCCPLCGKTGIRLVAFIDAADVLHMIGVGPMSGDSS
jgi:Putative transposase